MDTREPRNSCSRAGTPRRSSESRIAARGGRTGFKVNFAQGINARALTAETAAAIASVDYRDTRMKVRWLYMAWDHRKDKERLFRGLRLLTDAGIAPDDIMVYMLVG